MSTDHSENYYQQDEVSLKQILMFLYEGKLFISGFLSIVAIIAYFYLQSINPTYESHILYGNPSDLTVSKVNRAKFYDAKLIPSSVKTLEAEDIYAMVTHKISSTSFKEMVFSKYGYLERLNLNSEGDDIDNEIYGFLDRVRKDESSSTDSLTYIFMRGKDPLILTSFLNDLFYEADKDTLNDLKEIELNQINKKILSLSQEIAREEIVLKNLREEKIKRFNIELATAKAAKIDDIDLEKISVMYENTNLSTIENTSGISTIFPLWYLLGEDFIERELQQLTNEVAPNSTGLIQLNALLGFLKSYKYTIDNTISAADISWSLTPTSPIGPKKRLAMVIVLSIAFLFSVFFWYVIEIFRSPKR